MPDTVKSSDEFEEVTATVARDNARLELRRGRFRTAQEQLDRAMAVSPSDPQAYLALGELLRLRAQRARGAAERDELTRRALWAYEHSAMLDPALAEVVRELGLLYYQQGQRERALEAFMRYLVLSPDAPDAPRVSEYVAVLSQ
jgi:regulator of sirC expression with transglutaminase-like and TPR domain